jgi:hypothetical protein
MPLTGRAERQFSVYWLLPFLMVNPWLVNPAKRQLGKGSLCRYSACCCNHLCSPFQDACIICWSAQRITVSLAQNDTVLTDLDDMTTTCIVAIVSKNMFKKSLDNMNDSTISTLCFAHLSVGKLSMLSKSCKLSSVILVHPPMQCRFAHKECECLQLLVEKGADVNRPFSPDSLPAIPFKHLVTQCPTALHLACDRGDKELVKV